ncbi:nucleolar protein 10 [Iris pallida]|uniref:Nucleolar protein 10 n=1 Tax=Iris pallida TaxID=29817 RepID=A0AAX6HE02_IRIPA|nr:nucleolar protein 10 [Iris pallida]KAJ6838898.1 nucleolar protein 10 [Iris pallida]
MFIWLVFPSLVQLTSSCLTTKAGHVRLVSDYSGAGRDSLHAKYGSHYSLQIPRFINTFICLHIFLTVDLLVLLPAKQFYILKLLPHYGNFLKYHVNVYAVYSFLSPLYTMFTFYLVN